MKAKLTTILVLSALISQGQDIWTDKSRVLPDLLRKVPVAINVTHSPNPNYPELTTKDDKTKSTYVWRHATSMVSLHEDLEVVRAGSFIWYSAEGWKKNLDYDRKTFAKRFNCSNGVLKKGVVFTFEKNNRYGNNRYGGDALWYVIAKDKNGKLYKGISILETEAELLSEVN